MSPCPLSDRDCAQRPVCQRLPGADITARARYKSSMTDDLALLDRPAPGVAVLTLNRPAKYNALSGALLTAADRRLAELAAEASRGELRALVLTGADPAFCAGRT